MKKKFTLLLLSIFLIGNYTVFAQDSVDSSDAELMQMPQEDKEGQAEMIESTMNEESASFHQIIKHTIF